MKPGSITVEPAKRREIETRLATIEGSHGVRILLAVESGSRAWGFPSADSDYDVRFIFARSKESYLSFRRPREVLELPISELLDISGWDLRKAIELIMRSNATVGEWLTSPIIYQRDEPRCALISDFVRGQYSPRHYGRHYFHFAQKQWSAAAGKSTVTDKAYCYMMRTLLAFRWTVEHQALAPMAVDDLLAGVGLPYDVGRAFTEVRLRKMTGTELTNAERVPILDGWILNTLETAPSQCQGLFAGRPEAAAADRLFMQLIE
ncbi:MAG TPA: nucleotidyltransferase domain-containing protein [Alphaproteobacteria bacterium]